MLVQELADLRLGKRADEAESKRRALVESLAEAVRVSEEQMTASRETELKLQALGVDVITREADTLEQRLLKAVRDLDISQQEVDWFELNEAFAAQSLAVMRTLDLDPAKVNPLGGAIALGHPLGATGAIRTATLVHGLQRTKQRYGMVTMCIGTGMGAAGLFEAIF